MKTLPKDLTPHISGGLLRGGAGLAGPRVLTDGGVAEFAIASATPLADATRAFAAAPVVAVAAQTAPAERLTERHLWRFVADRLAPSEPDAELSDGLSDQGIAW